MKPRLRVVDDKEAPPARPVPWPLISAAVVLVAVVLACAAFSAGWRPSAGWVLIGVLLLWVVVRSGRPAAQPEQVVVHHHHHYAEH
jgi:uncharacterized membrane protein